MKTSVRRDGHDHLPQTQPTFEPLEPRRLLSVTFGGEQTIDASLDSPRAIYVADLDGDGDLDVLAAERDGLAAADDKVVWYANDGTGSFGGANTITASVDGVADVFAADLDGDGDMDAISLSWNADASLYWYANDGAGNFTVQPLIDTLVAGGEVHAADVDADGDVDILAADAFADEILWSGISRMASRPRPSRAFLTILS